MGVNRVLEENKEMVRGTYVDEIIRLEEPFYELRKVKSLMDKCNKKLNLYHRTSCIIRKVDIMKISIIVLCNNMDTLKVVAVIEQLRLCRQIQWNKYYYTLQRSPMTA
ncbi:hypothetical protein KQX54_008815 [Cotesia glomerata]|uniref:Uncharacterized protein n=1 Tax=Cotesia glomerata TaxID=32391 RepID=A0AAV7J6F7_COTGL|nr:hypothetical protein KQX54_008815 [Cotesia glomerata]